MPQFLARCIIILVVVFIVFLFRKVLKRLIFILVLLGLSFFIYGLITPSGASALWNTVKDIPVQLAVFFGGEESVKVEKDESVKVEESMKVEEYESVKVEGKKGKLIPSSSFIRDTMFETGDDIVDFFIEESSSQTSPVSSTTLSQSSLQTSSQTSLQTSSKALSQTSSHGLTAQEIREAEELFSILLQ